MSDGPWQAPSNDFRELHLYMSIVSGHCCRRVSWAEHLKKVIKILTQKKAASQSRLTQNY